MNDVQPRAASNTDLTMPAVANTERSPDPNHPFVQTLDQHWMQVETTNLSKNNVW